MLTGAFRSPPSLGTVPWRVLRAAREGEYGERAGQAIEGSRERLRVSGERGFRGLFLLPTFLLQLTASAHFRAAGLFGERPRAAGWPGLAGVVLGDTGSVSPRRQAIFLGLIIILKRKERKNASCLVRKNFRLQGRGFPCGSIPHSLFTLDSDTFAIRNHAC